jgi:hypothetical protein
VRAEVEARRGFHAERAVAVVGAVQILLQDLRLAERALEPRGVQRLGQLAEHRARVELGLDQADELHADGGSAIGDAQRAGIEPERSQHAERIDPGVLVEAMIFGGQARLHRHGRDLQQRGPVAALAAGATRSPEL